MISAGAIYFGPPVEGWALVAALAGFGVVLLGCVALLVVVIRGAIRSRRDEEERQP